MPTFEHITLSELQNRFQSLNLPPDTRMTVKIEESSKIDDSQLEQKELKRQKALEAMEKLKGSGSGNLVEALLEERKKDLELW